MKKPFPGRVPADKALAAKKTNDTRKLRYKDSLVRRPTIATHGDIRALLFTITTLLEAKRDRLGRLDFATSSDMRSAREVIRLFAVKFDVGGCADVLEQAAKVARVMLAK